MERDDYEDLPHGAGLLIEHKHPICWVILLAPTALTIDEIYIESTGRNGKKQKQTLHMKLYSYNDELLETWKKYNSFVFLLHYHKINAEGYEVGAHYVVVTVEFRKDFWWATVTGDNVYG